MKKNTVLLIILNITFSSAISLKQRLKRSTETEINSSVVSVEDLVVVHEFHFSQKLDHVNEEQYNATWPQRYVVSVDYYKKSGPAFLYIFGSRPMNSGYGFPDALRSYARNLNAICFALEHRFYSTTPLVNGSIISHLSTSQALADIANFIKGMNKEFHLPKDVKWIVFGCSYGGTLAAWARRKYPHLIHGAVASSAALLAKVDYYEYYQIAEESLKSYDSKCVESITVAFEEIARFVDSPQNIKNITELFNLGDIQLPNFINIQTYITYLMLLIIEKTVQNTDLNLISIPLVCRTMIECNGTKLEAFAKIRKMIMEVDDSNFKMPSEKSQDQNSAEDEDEEIDRAWMYQRCSEFGYFSSYSKITFLSAVKHLLNSIEFDIRILCEQFFSSSFSIKNLTEKVSHTNSQHGGLDFNVCNTLFIHGSLDPWYKTGLFKTSNASLYETIFIEGTSHCADLLPPSDRDIPALKNARKEVLKTLNRWLKK